MIRSGFQGLMTMATLNGPTDPWLGPGGRPLGWAMALLVVVGLATAARADHQLFVTGAATDFTRSSMRVISITPGGVSEVTADGLRIGTAGSETRVAFVRPLFTSNVSGLSEYQVTTATLQFNPSSVSILVPTTAWDAGTPPTLLASIFKQATRPATGTDLTSTFQTLLTNGNRPYFGQGFVLSSTQDFRTGNVMTPQFLVKLMIRDFIRINFFAPLAPIPPLVPGSTTVVPNFLLSWTPSRSGLASLAFNQTLLLSEQPVQRLRAIPTIVPAAFIQTGGVTVNNTVTIDLFPFDAPVGASPMTTIATFNVSTTIR